MKFKNKNRQFFHLLQTNLSMNETISETDSICLISQQSLDDTKITLICGHSFNYKALFNEVYKQKYHKNKTEIQRVQHNEIKCPYCRKIQKGILPYIEGFGRIKYVNSPQTMVMLCNTCIYTFKSGKRKGMACNKRCVDKYCPKCTYYMKKRAVANDLVSDTVGEVCANLVLTDAVNGNLPLHSLCSATIKTGLRKGLHCRHPAKHNGKCGIHKSKQN